MKTELNKKNFNIIFQGRTDLTEYEKDQLIPELKSRLAVLKGYFEDIVKISNDLAESDLFTQNLYSILNPKSLESQKGNVKKLAEEFFSSIKKQAKVENIEDIDRILKKYKNIERVNDLGLFLNEVNLLCSSMLNVYNKMFYFKIEAYPHVVDGRTGQTVAGQPNQYFLTTEPFQITIQNIVSVCKATSETVHEWHKHAMRMKTQLLDLYNNRLTIRNSRLILFIQITTIFLAIGLSAFFLTANDPFSLFKKSTKQEKEIMRLNNEKNDLESQIDKLEKQIGSKSK